MLFFFFSSLAWPILETWERPGDKSKPFCVYIALKKKTGNRAGHNAILRPGPSSVCEAYSLKGGGYHVEH